MSTQFHELSVADITRETPACFEPTIDYCVVKIPRFAFEKFPGTDSTLTTQMKSVGEVMAIGYLANGYGSEFCTGTLVSAAWISSAACATSRSAKDGW